MPRSRFVGLFASCSVVLLPLIGACGEKTTPPPDATVSDGTGASGGNPSEAAVSTDSSSNASMASTGGSVGPATSGGGAATTEAAASTGGGGADQGATSTGTTGNSLSQRYPDDMGIGEASTVLFHDDFEDGWGRWDGPEGDTQTLFLETDEAVAHAGTGYLRSTVTEAQLQEDEFISSAAWTELPERVDSLYWRFHVQFKNVAPNPHHWVRVAAGDADYDSSGLANTVPEGDRGFWFDLDANNDDIFNFYVYWYEMRSGRCNDGSATPGCAGDQGSTYYYGNVFRPPEQDPFPRDQWFCIELHAQTNQPGSSDGQLTLWVDDRRVGDYGPGYPEGTWLRDQFHAGGCDFSACTQPQPFDGFDFRSSSEVRFKKVLLDAYYERDSSAAKRDELESRGLTVSNEQTILYDDVVVATERIGCRVVTPGG